MATAGPCTWNTRTPYLQTNTFSEMNFFYLIYLFLKTKKKFCFHKEGRRFLWSSPRQTSSEAEHLKALLSSRGSHLTTRRFPTDSNKAIGQRVFARLRGFCKEACGSVECGSSVNAPFSSADTPRDTHLRSRRYLRRFLCHSYHVLLFERLLRRSVSCLFFNSQVLLVSQSHHPSNFLPASPKLPRLSYLCSAARFSSKFPQMADACLWQYLWLLVESL